METIYKYEFKDVVEDGILFDIIKINPDWRKGILNFVTTNLLEKGYLKNDEINILNVLDLLNQANKIVKRKSKNFTEFDSFFAGNIELPTGSQQPIFICQNETKKFTIMLPEDY